MRQHRGGRSGQPASLSLPLACSSRPAAEPISSTGSPRAPTRPAHGVGGSQRGCFHRFRLSGQPSFARSTAGLARCSWHYRFATGAYSIAAALGSAMGGRANAAIEEKDAKDRKAKAQAAWDTAKAELDTLTAKPVTELQSLIDTAKTDLAKLPATRSVAEIEASLRAARRDPYRYSCTLINGSLGISCPKLDAEKARALQRERLTAKIGGWAGEMGQADQRRLSSGKRLRPQWTRLRQSWRRLGRPRSQIQMPWHWQAICPHSASKPLLIASISCWSCSP